MGQWSTPADAPFVVQIRQKGPMIEGWLAPNKLAVAPPQAATLPPIMLGSIHVMLCESDPSMFEDFKTAMRKASVVMMKVALPHLQDEDVKAEFRDVTTGRVI